MNIISLFQSFVNHLNNIFSHFMQLRKKRQDLQLVLSLELFLRFFSHGILIK